MRWSRKWLNVIADTWRSLLGRRYSGAVWVGGDVFAVVGDEPGGVRDQGGVNDRVVVAVCCVAWNGGGVEVVGRVGAHALDLAACDLDVLWTLRGVELWSGLAQLALVLVQEGTRADESPMVRTACRQSSTQTLVAGVGGANELVG